MTTTTNRPFGLGCFVFPAQTTWWYPGDCFFRMSPYARASTCICIHNIWKNQRPIWKNKTYKLKRGCYVNGKQARGTGKWEMGTKPNLHPGPSVTPFPILCFVPIFLFPVPLARSLLPVPRFSNIRVKTRSQNSPIMQVDTVSHATSKWLT